MAKLKTYLGYLNVFSVGKDYLGYYAIVGNSEYNIRKFYITKEEYEKLKKDLEMV